MFHPALWLFCTSVVVKSRDLSDISNDACSHMGRMDMFGVIQRQQSFKTCCWTCMASCLQATPNADDTVAAFFGEGVTYFHAVADAYPLVHAQDVPAAALEDEARGRSRSWVRMRQLTRKARMWLPATTAEARARAPRQTFITKDPPKTMDMKLLETIMQCMHPWSVDFYDGA